MAEIKIDPEKGELVRIIKANLNKNFRKVKKEWVKESKDILKGEIIKAMSTGRSPVKGEGRYDKYSPSYLKRIKEKKIPGKKARPVNLKVTGKLHRSIRVRETLRGMTVFFTSRLAKIHSELGAGKSKVIRKIFPKKGTAEEFSRVITRKLRKILRDKSKKLLPKLTRRK